MPGTSEERLGRMAGREKNPRAKLRLLACRERKRGRSIRGIAGDLGVAYSTARGWLVRMRGRGLRGRFNRGPRGRGGVLSRAALRAVRGWLKRSPQWYGFESGSWQLDMVIEMIRREFGTGVKTRTLRRWLRRIGFSGRKDRRVPRRSASRRRRDEFKREVGERARQRRAAGRAAFTEDEASAQMGQNPAYGWGRAGGCEETRTSFSSRAVRIFGAMSEDELRIKVVDSTNSQTFREFLGEIRRDRPQFYMALDNASYHKSKAVREYVESTGGDVELEFLPPYTPQLNPVETVWRDLKKRLAGRFFRSLDELKAAITAILEREMGNRLKGYLVA